MGVLILGEPFTVWIAAGQHAHVQRDLGVVGEGLEDVPGQRARVVATDDDIGLGIRLTRVHDVGAPCDVDDGLHERLVEGHRGITEARDPALVTERLPDRLAQHDGDVLDGVVGVDVGVPGRLDREVDQRVLGQREQHVVVERHPRADLPGAGAVEVDADLDGALGGGPAHRGGAVGVDAAHGASPEWSVVRRWVGARSASAARNAVVSSGVPAVTRR